MGTSARTRIAAKFTFLAVVSALVAGCATTGPSPGQALPGLTLQAADDTVGLLWAPDSPLGRSVRRNDVFLLLATYDTDAGLVTDERIATSRVDSSGQGVALKLPGTLRNVPLGAVCMRMVRNQRQVIPLRVAGDGQRSDTFRYADWEPIARENTKAGLAQLKLDSNARQRRRTAAFAAEVEDWKQQRDVSDISQCDSLNASVTVSQPRSAVHPSRRARAASEQCVNQFGDEARLQRRYRRDLGAIQFAKEVASLLAGKQDDARGRKLQGDVERFALILDSNAPPRLPVFGLGLTSSTRASLKEASGELNVATASAIAGAYGVCLDEAKDQFELAYDAWQAELATGADRSAARTEVVRKECRRVFERGEGFAKQLAALDAEAAEIQRDLASLNNASSRTLPQQVSLATSQCAIGN